MAPSGNGTLGKILGILLSALFVISMALASNGLAALERRVYETEKDVKAIVALEAKYDLIQKQLDRIEQKIDDHMMLKTQ